MGVKINYECPNCGTDVEIEKDGHFVWDEGFDTEGECPDCGDKVTVKYMLEAR